MPGDPPAAALTVVADAPDRRDRFYAPSLWPLREAIPPPPGLRPLDQGASAACTGFGLAATINLLYRFQHQAHRVSPWMLYAMARRYDAWPGEDYPGSSCRGAIKGWRNSGVCLERLAPRPPGRRPFVITPEIAEDARRRTPGAYYRLHPELTDFHAALNEVGVIFASARVHEGWYAPRPDADGEVRIPEGGRSVGGHAFAIVGYNHKGFWVLNSWGGAAWGHGGLALWGYADWARHVLDAWVVQLALPFPVPLAERAGEASVANRAIARAAVPRRQIEPHFVHLDDGAYHDRGRYWSNRRHMDLVGRHLANGEAAHLLLYAHGGLNGPGASARRIAAMQRGFLANGIHPVHIMYDTGLVEELKDVLRGRQAHAERVAGGLGDWLDRRLEDLTRPIGRALWREMKAGARRPFATREADGSDALARLLAPLRERGMSLHLVGHSTGSILHAHLLARVAVLFPELQVRTVSLLAPAAPQALFEASYLPLLRRGRVRELCCYILSDRLERDDRVAGVYGKSLLYLVSRAYEAAPLTPLLGLERDRHRLDLRGLPVAFVTSDGEDNTRCASRSHGGFDNDPYTLNDVLTRILGRPPEHPFTAEALAF